MKVDLGLGLVRVGSEVRGHLVDTRALGILHYDSDYDLVAEKTGLSYESV